MVVRHRDGPARQEPMDHRRESESLSDTLSATAKRDFETRASLALSILTRTLHRGPKMLVYAERDPAKIWTKLAAKHQPKERIYQVALRSQYIKLLASAGSADTMTTYLTELKVVVDKLAAVGVEMEEEVVTLDLLASLPTAFKTLVTAVSAQQEVPALSFVEDKVLEEEERIKEHEDRAAPAGQAFTVGNGFRNNNKSSNGNNNNNNNSSSNNSNTSIRKCDWCGINNHWSVDCRRRLQHQNLIETYLQHNNLLPKTP
ncbi:unnamed protein product [Tilletia caries]|nr:unnamed protein product [Tilletia caries]